MRNSGPLNQDQQGEDKDHPQVLFHPRARSIMHVGAGKSLRNRIMPARIERVTTRESSRT